MLYRAEKLWLVSPYAENWRPIAAPRRQRAASTKLPAANAASPVWFKPRDADGLAFDEVLLGTQIQRATRVNASH